MFKIWKSVCTIQSVFTNIKSCQRWHKSPAWLCRLRVQCPSHDATGCFSDMHEPEEKKKREKGLKLSFEGHIPLYVGEGSSQPLTTPPKTTPLRCARLLRPGEPDKERQRRSESKGGGFESADDSPGNGGRNREVGKQEAEGNSWKNAAFFPFTLLRRPLPATKQMLPRCLPQNPALPCQEQPLPQSGLSHTHYTHATSIWAASLSPGQLPAGSCLLGFSPPTSEK